MTGLRNDILIVGSASAWQRIQWFARMGTMTRPYCHAITWLHVHPVPLPTGFVAIPLHPALLICAGCAAVVLVSSHQQPGHTKVLSELAWACTGYQEDAGMVGAAVGDCVLCVCSCAAWSTSAKIWKL